MTRMRIAAALLAVSSLPPAYAAARICNIRILTDASPDYHDLDSMIRSITHRWDTPADKCWAMFYWNHIARRQTSPMFVYGLECTDPIRQFNDYGYTMCSTVAGINCAIWDAMGLKVRFWDISAHTVPEVFYDERWHMYDNSMSAIYTLCDGRTIAAVEDIGKQGACPASDGKTEPGHIARYHCLNATGPNGFLTGADCPRDLEQEYRCFNPNGLKYRYYYNNWDRGHRYILNLRSGEVYTRHYAGLGDSPEYYVPNHGKDPEQTNPRYKIRGNGIRTFTPDLADPAADAFYSLEACRIIPAGLTPSHSGRPANAVFKIEGANVITSLRITGSCFRSTDDDLVSLSISTTNGLTWQKIWTDTATGEAPFSIDLREPVNGRYDLLVKATLAAHSDTQDVRLAEIHFRTVTMLNSKTQPSLLIGRNTVYVGAGDQTESIVVQPDLQGENYKPWIVDADNIATKAEHPGYQGVMHAAETGRPAWVVFRVEAPRDISRITYGGRFYNRAPKSHIDLLHSFDNGRTWNKTWSLSDTQPPWDVIHYETDGDIPAGTRSVLFKYLLEASAAGSDACSIYGLRMEVNHAPADPAFTPLEITFNWSEVQADYSLVERSHTELITRLPHTYNINVAGVDHPVVNSLTASVRGARPQLTYGYSDGIDHPGTKYLHRWSTCGTNLALARPYTVSVPSNNNWDAGDPDNTKLTDGIVGPPYPGGIGPRYALCWDQAARPVIDLDLGSSRRCGAFAIQLGAGWPWWDAIKGQIQDKVEVLTAAADGPFTSRGFFQLNLRRRDIPVNHMMPDDETAGAFNYHLVLPEPVTAQRVRFRITPARTLTVSEVQVFDYIRSEPFDLRIALPEDAPANAQSAGPDNSG